MFALGDSDAGITPITGIEILDPFDRFMKELLEHRINSHEWNTPISISSFISKGISRLS
jgi:hypothetical protein